MKRRIFLLKFGTIPAEVNSTVVPMILSVIIVSCMLGVYNLLNSLEQQAFAQRTSGQPYGDHREVSCTPLDQGILTEGEGSVHLNSLY
jgi:hypothetical protein